MNEKDTKAWEAAHDWPPGQQQAADAAKAAARQETEESSRATLNDHLRALDKAVDGLDCWAKDNLPPELAKEVYRLVNAMHDALNDLEAAIG